MPDHSDDRVVVLPFNRQYDSSEVVIGPSEQGSFFALPKDAVEILDDLAAGSTFGEARDNYERKYGEVPDLASLLGALEAEGFVHWRTGVQRQGDQIQSTPKTRVTKERFHLSSIPESLAKRIYSTPFYVVGGLLVVLGFFAAVTNSSILPGPSALFLSYNVGATVLYLVPLVAMAIALHELSHLVAARARGVPARFSIGNRLWILVIETNMTRVWTVPREKRYLPLLAGSMTDAISAAILILILTAQSHGHLYLSEVGLAVVRALLVIYFYQLIWQCFFFVRTDFYYAIANYYNCKNLLGDTANFAWNQWVRLTGWGEPKDLSGVPESEMKVVRWYSIIWFLGRVLSLTLLTFIQIPLFIHYIGLVVNSLSGTEVVPTVLVPALFAVVTFGAGFYLWIRSMRRAQ